MSIGIKKTLKTIFKFPPIIVTPMFSIWTIGPLTSGKSCCCRAFNCKSRNLGVSNWLTWVNLMLTFAFALAYSIWHDVGTFGFSHDGKIFGSFLFIFCPFLLLTLIFLILLQCLDKCPSCCCPCLSCCKKYCYPVTEYTYLDMNDMDALITQQDIEMAAIENENKLPPSDTNSCKKK